MLGIIAISILAFALRVIPTRRREWFGSDAYYHMLVSRSWRTYRKFPRTDPNLLPTNPNTYPPLLQVFLYPVARISERVALRYLSPAFDLATIILLYITSEWIALDQPLLPSLIYAVSAANLLDASTLNPRPLGNALLAGTSMVLLRYAQTGDLLLYMLLLLMEALVLLSHKLTVQVLIPFVVVVSIVTLADSTHPAYAWPMLVSIPLSMLVAGALTAGAYLRKILPDHIRYIRLHLKLGHYSTGERAFASPFNLLKSNPVSYVAPFLGLYLHLQSHGVNTIPGYGIWLPWSGTVLVLAQFWVWGDSWRYLQLGTFPSSMILVHFVTSYFQAENGIALVFVLIIAGLGAIAYKQVRDAMRRDIALKIVTSLEAIPTELRARLKGTRVYANVHHYIVPYITEASVLLGSPSTEGMRQSYRIAELRKTSLKNIAEYSSKELKEPLDYFMLFKDFPSPSTEGFVLMQDSRDIRIYKEA